MSFLKNLYKAEDPAGYAKLANEGILLGYPVKIQGQSHRPDNNIGYHSSIKFFDPLKDHPHVVHGLARHLPLNPPNPKNTQIEPGQFKDRFGNDVYVLKLKGNSAEKIKEHNGKFTHMGFPATYAYEPHISVDKATHDKIKASGAKTAHEAGISFGPAELKRGSKTLKTYHHAPDTTEPAVPDESDFTAKVNVTKAENTLGNKPLMKPYRSEAQRRWAHTESGKEALGGESGVHEWDQATKGKKLPERIKKTDKICLPKKDFINEHEDLVDTLKHPSKKKTNKEIKEQSEELKEEKDKLEKGAIKNALIGGAALLGSHAHAASGHLHQFINGLNSLPGVKVSSQFVPAGNNPKNMHGTGQYSVRVGNYVVHGHHNSNGAGYSHKVGMDGPKNPTSNDLQDQKKAKFLRDKLETTGSNLLEKSESIYSDFVLLEKGALKNAGIALGMAGAIAGGAHKDSDAAQRMNVLPNHSQNAPQYDHHKMLRAISQVESSGGKNTKHAAGGGPIHGNEHAVGKYGLMPETIRETINGHKDLKAKHGKALALRGQQLHNYMQDNKGLEDVIADRHLSHMEHVLGQNPSHLGYGWLNGINGTLKARKNGENLTNHWHAKKVSEAYNKEK